MSEAPCLAIPPALKVAIEAAKVISFDIFDTAIRRAVENPVDLFLLVATELRLDDPRAFVAARIKAERVARDRLYRASNALEVTLVDIYDHLRGHPSVVGSPLSEVMEKERELEYRMVRRNKEIGAAFDWAKGLGKTIGFISDIYLDRPLVEAMLKKAGYQGYAFLWVSSDVKATKAEGGLYTRVHQALAIEASEHLHIGDNRASDGQRAKAKGIVPYLIDKSSDRLPKTLIGRRFRRQGVRSINWALRGPHDTPGRDLWTTLWRGLVADHLLESSQDFWFELGYRYVGLFLLGFGLWLDQTARAKGVKTLYFLARDGHLMLRVHEKLRARGMAVCEGRYFFASRRALNIPALTLMNDQALDFLVSGTSRLSVRAFLSRVGLDAMSHLNAMKGAGFLGPDDPVEGRLGYRQLRALFESLEPLILEKAADERARFRAYCEQEGVFKEPVIGLVDIGWHGSLQESFTTLMAHEGHGSRVEGFYVGTYAAAKKHEAVGACHHAYLFKGGEPQKLLKVVRASVEIFEWFFCAPHGSVLGFDQAEGGGVKPLLDESDLEAHRQSTAARVQEGALQFLDDALGVFPDGAPPPGVPPELSITLIEALLRRPTLKEARFLGDLPHLEGFGSASGARYVAKPHGGLIEPWTWRELLSGYRQAFWRPGYLKRLTWRGKSF